MITILPERINAQWNSVVQKHPIRAVTHAGDNGNFEIRNEILLILCKYKCGVKQ
jgi:hypothetical protein